MARRIKGLSDGGGGATGISTKEPASPPDADFAIYIDFKRGTGNPQRVFQAADSMIRALQKLDRALCAAVDTGIEPVMLLEEIETGSIKIWLANQFNKIEDSALKELDWRPLVGKYLVRAKYAFIKWSNKDGEDGSLLALSKEIRQIGVETDIRHIPDYAPPSMQELADSARKVDEAKSFLHDGDHMVYLPRDDAPINFNLSVKWAPNELAELVTRETTKFGKRPMTPIVKRPDYLGNAKWDLRHGKKVISAKIEDEKWLKSFQSRKVDVRPGDALRCKATIEHHYGYDYELISEEYTITEVDEVLENQITQGNLDLDGIER